MLKFQIRHGNHKNEGESSEEPKNLGFVVRIEKRTGKNEANPSRQNVSLCIPIPDQVNRKSDIEERCWEPCKPH
jgi:hypothetical protein